MIVDDFGLPSHVSVISRLLPRRLSVSAGRCQSQDRVSVHRISPWREQLGAVLGEGPLVVFFDPLTPPA